jgi:hypothetical protein
MRDITKNKQDSERYKVLFESSMDAIMILEPPTWRFTNGNQAAIKMFKAKDGKQFISFGPGDFSPKYQPDKKNSSNEAKKMIELALKNGSSFFNWTHKRLNGEEFQADVMLTRVKLGDKIFIQATVRDVSERKKAEQKIEEQVNELEKFNRLMVGRELKMIELKERIKELEQKGFVVKKTKTWSEKFQEAVDLEEGFIEKLESFYLSEIDNSDLGLIKKNKAKSLVKILVRESRWHKDLFVELIKSANENR